MAVPRNELSGGLAVPAESATEDRAREGAQRGASIPLGPPTRRRAGRSYSWFVRISKGLLPLIAAALIATIAVWPYVDVKEGQFRVGPARISYEDAALNVRLVRPRYTGVDQHNRPYMLTAEDASQVASDSDMVTLLAPKADLELDNGSWVALSADEGAFFKDLEILDLVGNVNLYHDQGYEFETTSAQFDIPNSVASGEEPIAGQGPFGRIRAEGFRVEGEGTTVHFLGRTSLVIHPKAETAPADGGGGQ